MNILKSADYINTFYKFTNTSYNAYFYVRIIVLKAKKKIQMEL